MPGPTVAWTDISLAEFDPKSYADAALFTAMRDNQEHLKEVAYDSLSYTGGSAHAHDGSDSASVDAFAQDNLLLNATPYDDGVSTPDRWTSSGFSSHDATQTQAANNAGSYIYQTLLNSSARRGAFGDNGADFVISCFAASVGTQTNGSIQMGIADGGTDEVDYLVFAEFDHSEMNTGWGRYYARGTNLGGGATTDLRFLWRINNTFSTGVLFTGFQVTLGSVLTRFQWSNAEKTANVYTFVPSLPLFDEELAMRQAIDVT